MATVSFKYLSVLSTSNNFRPRYISETITLDRDRFKPAQCESGFAMDPDVEMRNVNFLGDPSLQDPANILSMNEILNSLL